MTSSNAGCVRSIVCAAQAALLAAVGMSPNVLAAEPAAPANDFQSSVASILAQHCARCHGPEKQSGGLRLDEAAAIAEGGDNGPVVEPGKPGESLLYNVLVGANDAPKMPPKGRSLRPEEVFAIKTWIAGGAHGLDDASTKERTQVASEHWSFQPIKRPQLPAVRDARWARNPIDVFILARLEAKGFRPAPEADRTTLLRRLNFDLTGLPPAPRALDAFAAAQANDAYEQAVDRLLDAPQFGERWGRHWLDVARYADSNGYTIDGPRSMWKYRDWVIDAINRDLPFDQFTIEQLAGDLLERPRLDQIVATGFQRNTMFNEEGGIDQEQFRIERVVDRVNTTGVAFLGLSIGCAQCHTHKFDPITQKEYYEFLAFFNSTEEPQIDVPPTDEPPEQQALIAQIAALKKRLNSYDSEAAARQPAWEKERLALYESYLAAAPASFVSAGGASLRRLDDGSILAGGQNASSDVYTVVSNVKATKMTGLRLEVLTDSSLPQKGPGRAGNGNFVLSSIRVFAAPLGDPSNYQPVEMSAALADHSQKDYPVAGAIDANPKTGWAINTEELGAQNVPRTAVFTFKAPIGFEQGTTLKVELDHRHGSGYNIGRFRLAVTTAPAPLEVLPAEVGRILALDPSKRIEAEKKAVASAFHADDAARRKMTDEIAALEKKRPPVPTVMVMKELMKPRDTFVHIRGDFLRRGQTVYPDVPAVLPPLHTSAGVSSDQTRRNRLDLARWLVDANNPLTARVVVNRIWQHYFGIGLVETENDFGKEGTPPSHPELLDWLAREFIDGGWNVKRLHRLIVTSAAYRQASTHRPELAEADPDNRMLGRQRRLRLEAEVVRDAALAASGVLSQKLGGPSVFPYQPAGVMRLAQIDRTWEASKGEDRFRRGVYTYFWRSTPHPFLKAFDAPNAQTTCTRRNRSNTPLQSLMLLNDQAFIELAQALAKRTLTEAAKSDVERIENAFRHCLGRTPNDVEKERLVAYLDEQRREFAASESEAKSFAGPEIKGVAVAEQAAWTALGRVLLNTDEFITRE